jgi:hypothetical protein
VVKTAAGDEKPVLHGHAEKRHVRSLELFSAKHYYYILYIYVCRPIHMGLSYPIKNGDHNSWCKIPINQPKLRDFLLLVVSVFKLHTGPFFVGRTSPRDLSCTCNCFQVTFQVLKSWQKAQWLTKVTCPRVKNLAESQESKVCLLLNSSLRCAWFWIEHGRDPLVPLGFSPCTMHHAHMSCWDVVAKLWYVNHDVLRRHYWSCVCENGI